MPQCTKHKQSMIVHWVCCQPQPSMLAKEEINPAVEGGGGSSTATPHRLSRVQRCFKHQKGYTDQCLLRRPISGPRNRTLYTGFR